MEPFLPASLYQFVRIRSLPGVLGLLVTVLALGTLAQTLMGVGQRRRREVAVLKTLGFTRRQIAGSALCQAAAFTALALVIGLPLGAALGRLAWGPITDRLGLPDGPVVPVGLLAALVPAALVVTLVSSILPAWGMARRDPARSLRAE